MLEVFDVEQGTEEWFACRLGIPTASRFKDILAKGEGKMRRTYMMDLLGERLTGRVVEGYKSADMERGNEQEAEARAAYTFQSDVDPIEVGFIRNGEKGCSPDSLIGEDGMLEIKTRNPRLQLELLLDQKLPSEHKAQVQGQLWVAERKWCDFVSYCPGLKMVLIRVERDEEYIRALAEEVSRFVYDMNELSRRYEAI
jgi:hypothetical protein